MQPSTPTRSSSLRAAVAAAALALALAGCEAASEKASEAAIESALGGDADVERDGDRTVIRTAEGELAMTSGDDLQLPGDFPDDVYLPDDYRVQNVIDSGDGRAIGLVADGPLDRLAADASAQMEDHGWEQVMATRQPQGRMLGYQKGERATMLIFTPVEDDQVRIGVTLASRQ